MGCGKSKIKNIDIKPDPEETKSPSPPHHKEPISTVALNDDAEDSLPNRLLAAIPISDLGESLDSRHLSESFNGQMLKKGGADRYVLLCWYLFFIAPCSVTFYDSI